MASSAPHKMAPPRGPRRVLWVVKVTTSATPTGLGWTLPAMSPAGWAASNMKRAPTSSAISRNGTRVDRPGVGRSAGDDQLRALPQGEVANHVEVDPFAGAVGRRRCHPVGDESVQLARDADRRAMGEVPALVEAHGEDRVARLDERQVGGQVRVRAGVRLDVGVLGPEQLRRPSPGEVLDLVGDDVPAVVAPPWVALRVLVRQHRRRGGEHGRRGEVLRRDELEARSLALELTPEQGVQLRVAGERLRQESAAVTGAV